MDSSQCVSSFAKDYYYDCLIQHNGIHEFSREETEIGNDMALVEPVNSKQTYKWDLKWNEYMNEYISNE